MKMSKSKSSSKAAKSTKSDDVLTKVKDAAITKPAQNIKAKSKDLAKQVAAKEEKKDKKDKKNKKKAKEPTPEPSDSEESASSESSESESEEETKKPVSKVSKSNGSNKKVTATAAKAKDLSDSESDSDESIDDAAPAAKAAVSDEDSDADSSDESSEDEKPVQNVVNKIAAVGEVLKDNVKKAVAGESESESDSDSSEESDDDKEVATKPAKRKADDEVEQTAKKSKTENLDTSKGANLFVGNLSWNVDEAWLKEVFEEFGEVAGVRIVTERDSGRSKGFGYVEFVKPEDAAKAHAAKAGAELDGRNMNVDFANARPDKSQQQENRRKSYGDQVGEASDTLFLGNLSFEVGQEAVTEAFAAHGTILGIRLPTDRETGQPKGFGYVTFSSVDEATTALEAMQGAYIEGRPIRLDYSSPRPQNNDSGARGRGGFGGRGNARGGRGGRGDRGGRGGSFGGRGGRGGRGGSTNRGGFGDFSGRKTSFD